MESNVENKENEFDDFKLTLCLLIFSGILGNRNDNLELEKEIEELKGKMSIIERMI